MKIIEQDILTVESGIICHQVNCQGVMGAGIAKAIANKWPKVLKEYKRACIEFEKHIGTSLGEFSYSQVGLTLFVGNIFGQDNYGKDKCYTNYTAVNDSFVLLKSFADGGGVHEYEPVQVYVPWKMGCGLGGGNWDKYRKIIEKYIPDVIYCKLPGVKQL